MMTYLYVVCTMNSHTASECMMDGIILDVRSTVTGVETHVEVDRISA